MFDTTTDFTWTSSDPFIWKCCFSIDTETFLVRYEVIGRLSDKWTVTLHQMVSGKTQSQKPSIARVHSDHPLRAFSAVRHSILEFVFTHRPEMIVIQLPPDKQLCRIYNKTVPKYLQHNLELYDYRMHTTPAEFQFSRNCK